MTALVDLSRALSAVVASVAPSLVAVGAGRSRASGFVWKPGLVVTADEALGEDGEVHATLPDGRVVAAQRVGRDPSTDIALLRVPELTAPPVALVPADPVTGALALAVGARNARPVAALGVVSLVDGPWRSLRGGRIDALIRLDLRLPGSSEGGLALDAEGRAFGMTVLGPRRRTLVIPAATIERIAPLLETRGRVARGYLGLGMQAVPLDGGGTGVMVMGVDPKGPGAAAGIRQGDIVTAWNGQPVDGVRGLIRALGPESVGTALTLTLRRGGAELQAAVTVAERAAS
ncbi:S1C family serine protease [Muricoccus radiodurans]|uniref:S1C family serine protease n=1 Tax=Muricoccus radiodurans TaxID=2231721 RepID=UPI003CF116DA